MSTAERHDVRAGLSDTLPLALGIVSLGAAFGLVVTQAGLAWWWTPVFGIAIFAGSVEFLLLGLAVDGASLGAVALTTFLVNGRHVFYALSYPLSCVRGRLACLYAMYALTDESYALAATLPPDRRTSARLLSAAAGVQAAWVSGGLIGALGGEAFGAVQGADFALMATFVVLALDAIRASPDRAIPLLAGGCALIALLVAPSQMLLIACVLLIAVLAVRYHRDGAVRAL